MNGFEAYADHNGLALAQWVRQGRFNALSWSTRRSGALRG
jgi:hypothetical protein